MAYVDFSPEAAESVRFAAPAASPIEVGRFTSVEFQVIAAAERQDVTRELSSRSPLGRFLHRAFGLEPQRPLADTRLESLRRFASLAIHHPDQLDEARISAFVGAGYTEGQAKGLLAYLSGRRPRGRSA